jgi:hypothetical protein
MYVTRMDDRNGELVRQIVPHNIYRQQINLIIELFFYATRKKAEREEREIKNAPFAVGCVDVMMQSNFYA